MTENIHPGDLLGNFFEQIVSQDFTQTKGQFFTPIKIVTFMLALADTIAFAEQILHHGKDHLGRPRLPYTIDPASGSGTFIIEYMKLISNKIGDASYRSKLPKRIQEAHNVWFASYKSHAWAREYLFGVENN